MGRQVDRELAITAETTTEHLRRHSTGDPTPVEQIRIEVALRLEREWAA